MQELRLHIGGMYCDQCARTVTHALEQVHGVDRVTLKGETAHLVLEDGVGINALLQAVRKAGYTAREQKSGPGAKAWDALPGRLQALMVFAVSVAGVLLLGVGVNALFGHNIFNAIPAIDSSYSYGMLLGAGVLTGLHCMTMCGALNMASAFGGQERRRSAPLLYNAGRLVSYSAVGALAGALGGIVGVNRQVASVLLVIAAIVMVAMALRMAGIVSFSMPIPSFASRLQALSQGTPFVVGLANGFMPCGPLQAMQLYALSTGSPLAGALSLFLFCLGTMPIMLAMGYAAQLATGRARAVASKVAAAFLFVLALSMLVRGLSIVSTAGQVPAVAAFNTPAAERIVAVQEGAFQSVEFELDFDGYADIQVKSGVPVRMNIVAHEGKITGCNNKVVMLEWGVDAGLSPGDNVVEFTPTETGVFVYSCWMNMITNTVEVVE